MARWVQTCYGSKAKLVFGNTYLESECGFHQGDPIAGLIFSLVLHPILEAIQAEIPELRQGWYLDDGQLVGETEELGRAADIIILISPPAGLIMSTANTSRPGKSKSKVHIPPNTEWTQWPIGRVIEASPGLDHGFVFLGAPIGP
jgi:hypothetical protein